MTWIKVLGIDAPELEARIDSEIERKKKAREFSEDDLKYIEKLDLSVVKGELDVSVEDLEHLRKLSQLWDIDLKMYAIKSHRKILGPFIVIAKKLLFPVLRVFLKEFMQQQRAFNAEVISYLASKAISKRETHNANFEDKLASQKEKES